MTLKEMNDLVKFLLHRYAKEMNPRRVAQEDIRLFTEWLLLCSRGICFAKPCMFSKAGMLECKRLYCQETDFDFREIIRINFYAWAKCNRADGSIIEWLPSINLRYPYEVKEKKLYGVVYRLLLFVE